MTEKLRDAPKQEFKKGDLVKLRDGLKPEFLDALAPQILAGVAYRVMYFVKGKTKEEKDSVWLGPNDMSPQDVENFTPERAFELGEEKYKDAFPISTGHLRKALN